MHSFFLLSFFGMNRNKQCSLQDLRWNSINYDGVKFWWQVWSFLHYEKIGESAGQECKGALQETNKLLELGLKENRKAVKSLFNATEVSLFLILSSSVRMELEVPLYSNKFLKSTAWCWCWFFILNGRCSGYGGKNYP